MKKRILYIAPHRPGRSPGQRFRFEQYFDHFNKNDFEITYSYIVNAWDDKVLYAKGKYLLKLWIAFKAIVIRTKDWLRCENFDLIVIYREANFLGNIFFEKRFAKSKVPVVFDFDDAIWLNDVSDGNSNLKWLKRPEKTAEIIALSTKVIAGNNYLADYAKQYNSNVVIIPTSVNTDYHQAKSTNNENNVCIGWTGSSTTLKHFKEALPFLTDLKQKYGSKLTFQLIIDLDIEFPELDLISTRWNADTEIAELSKIDIGIMPLPNDKWSMGKCGFKGIQYMALSKPCVMSPVGVNTDIIDDSVNGFLANTNEEWKTKLQLLIESEETRQKLGEAGKKTIEERYSVSVQQKALLAVFNQLIE